jgi:hydrogenase nickel incorporation protein HypB
MGTINVEVKQDIRAERRAAAERFRRRMQKQGTYVVRLLSSPGSGKTTLLQETARRLGEEFTVAVLVGDVETQRDAERLAPFCPSIQITTGGACHLEMPLVERAFPQLNIAAPDFLFIEDIGNLICPASHDLGEHLRVLALSTTEGDDKPGKYPKAFRTSQVLVITKTDLLPYVPFSVDRARDDALLIQNELETIAVSALNGAGMEDWCELLCGRRAASLADVSSSSVAGP